MLCGSCDIGYAKSFLSDGCIRNDKVDYKLDKFLVYFFMSSFTYTVVLTFLPCVTKFVKKAYTSWKTMRNKETIEEDAALPLSTYVIPFNFSV